MANGLTMREKKFVKGIVENNLTPLESCKMAGYSQNPVNLQSYPYLLLKREKIQKALEKAGLSDNFIFKRLKRNTRVSKGEVVSVSDSNKALELSFRLKGYLDNDKENTNNNTTNVYIKELKQLNDIDINNRIDNITKEIEELKT